MYQNNEVPGRGGTDMVGEEMKEAEKEGGWSLTRKGENKDV